jgi:hypothetical protein
MDAVTWATGSGGDFDWLSTALRDRSGVPTHTTALGTAQVSTSWASPGSQNASRGIIYGIEEDANRIAAQLTTPRQTLATLRRFSEEQSCRDLREE